VTYKWSFTALALSCCLLIAPIASADQDLSYDPTPAYIGSIETFSACGFQDGEKVDLSLDGTQLEQAVAGGGCVAIPHQTGASVEPLVNHTASARGETSGKDQDGTFVVMPPIVTSPPTITISGYGSVLITGQFFPPGATVSGQFTPFTFGSNGDFFAEIFVPPSTPPGAYPMTFLDPLDATDTVVPQLPPVTIIVLPEPSTQPSASTQPASGRWTLTATSTLTRSDSSLTANGSSKAVALLQVANGQVTGHGQLSVTMDMKVPGASCHGDSAAVPFTVHGSQDISGLHLALSAANSTLQISVTCDNGLSFPFSPAAGTSTASPFDIPAVDGQTVDLDTSNQFVTVPPGFAGHTHVVLTAG
jgi:hypothetical protein